MAPAFSSRPPGTAAANVLSIDRMFVEWAIHAQRAEELKREVAARQATPADIARGHLLLCQLHIDRREPDEARKHLEALQPTLDKARLALLEKQIEQVAAAKSP